ncbi:MAG: P1 family peptidase [Longimicrobiales bacterium]|nr:P1 family peptidase [Longimicrobiales bacterium]
MRATTEVRRRKFVLVFLLPFTLLALVVTGPGVASAQAPDASERPRAREIGLTPGILTPGPLNAITDVDGVLVGHETVWEGQDVRTGVTAIRPHPGNVYLEKVPAAIHVGNGYGKLVGGTQVRELGEIETPILLTCTLCVWKAADALVEWMLEQDGMEDVRSVNPVVGETNDGRLNDIRRRPVTAEHVRAALEAAEDGPVEEGVVGAGTGTVAFGWRGGIGTSSRTLPEEMGGWTVGVLVQTNFGGILSMAGAPVGEALGQYSFRSVVEAPEGRNRETAQDHGPGRDRGGGFADDTGDGSIMIVVATDAPLSSRNLERLAARTLMGLARTGSFASNGSGDYVIAFSTHPDTRRRSGDGTANGPEGLRIGPRIRNDDMNGLFLAAVEATEEAIYNSLLKAVTVTGRGGRTVEALPVEATVEVLREHGVVEP